MEVKAIETITIDDVSHAKSELSDQAVQLINVFDEWNQTEADARSH